MIRHCGSEPGALPADGARVICVDDGTRWAIEGALTFANAGEVVAAAAALPLPAAGVVDCARIAAIDSAGVAVLLAIKRRALAESRPLAFAGFPAPLRALADVYGVEELLGIG